MVSFASPATQAEKICKKLSYMNAIASISTSFSYEACLTQVANSNFAKENHIRLASMTVKNCEDYLKIRATELGQKRLDMERQALQCMCRFFSQVLPKNGRLAVVRADKQQELKTRIYTDHQFDKVVSRMAEKNAFSTELARAAGLRAHELLTLRLPKEQPKSDRETISTKFKGMTGVLYTVVGKGGLIREVMIPHDMAAKLEKLRHIKPVRVTDRGIFYIQHYNISGGNKFSASFGQASIRALGWSNGAHGLRHTYAQKRMRELQVNQGLSWNLALKTISIELGHFRESITLPYLR